MVPPPSSSNQRHLAPQKNKAILRWPLPADDSFSSIFVLNLPTVYYEISEVLEAIGFFKSSSLRGSFQPRCPPWSAR